MKLKNDSISSKKDRSIYKLLHQPENDLCYFFYINILKDLSNCWNWIGFKTQLGYGQIKLTTEIGVKFVYSHRFSYMLFKGEIPRRYQIDHLCRNRSCVNPDHLEAVTAHENRSRSYLESKAVLEDKQYEIGLIKRAKEFYLSMWKVTPHTIELRLKKFLKLNGL